MRTAEISRKTKETDITVKMNLDGNGTSDIKTGIGFMDHMLESFAKHSSIDLYVRADGDLYIDMHHTVEDTGIVMGQSFKKALGDFRGITRFGNFFCPLDEALSRVVVDISGRPHLEWRVDFLRDKVGEMDTELFKEWFAAFAGNGGLTLHVESLYGENTHHIIEATYKALARAIRMAIAPDEKLNGGYASTKGVL